MVAGAPAGPASDVPTNEQHGRDGDRGGAIGREEEPAGERRERVGRVLEGEELAARFPGRTVKLSPSTARFES